MTEVTYVGTCSALVEKKSGWYEIQIAVPGKQYPVKADTKLEHLINDARVVRDSGQIATWTIDESESENINPRSGKPYTERRLNKVELGGTPAGGSEPAPPGPEPHHEAVHYADKDRLISRQVCLKAAATIFMGKAVTNFEDGGEDDIPRAVMAAAQRMELWLYRDIDPPPFE